MADKLQLDIEITPEGEVRIKTHGLKGNDCLEETEGLEKALGKVASREKTSEFFQQSTKHKGKATTGRG
jgi:hypothetical protein